MIGPSPDARGGVASVIASYRENGLLSEGRCRYLTTVGEGGGIRKLSFAAYALLQFASMLARGQVGLLHVHGASYRSFWRKRVFMLLAQWCGVPVIFHLHGGAFRRFVDHDAGTRRPLVIDTLAKCRLIYCLNEEVAQWLRERVPAVQVEVMPNPLGSVPKAPVFEARNRSILFLGRVEREKGVFDLLDAFRGVAESFPATRLVIGGSGGAREELEKALDDCGLSHRVDFLGWVDGARKSELLETVGAFVLPSHAEGMPMAILEAMAYGAPVVATDVGAVADMLDGGECGYLVKSGDVLALTEALRQVLAGEGVESRCRRAALRVRARYAPEVVLKALMSKHMELAR